MPHSGYTEGMEARYTITFDPFSEHYRCIWESLVEIEGERHIVHVTDEIPWNESHEAWVKENTQHALDRLEMIYIAFWKERQKLMLTNVSNH